MQIKFKKFILNVREDEVGVLNQLADENVTLDQFSIQHWETIDLLYKKHIIVYDKSRERKPEIQPWCRSVVLRTLLENQSGN